jgi:hypothetical protein
MRENLFAVHHPLAAENAQVPHEGLLTNKEEAEESGGVIYAVDY